MNDFSDLNSSIHEEGIKEDSNFFKNKLRLTFNYKQLVDLSNDSDKEDDDVILLDDDDFSGDVIKTGTRVFALYDFAKHIWKPAKIESVIVKNEKFKVKFNNLNEQNTSYQLEEYDDLEISEKSQEIKTELDATCIAYINSPAQHLSIRSRVVSFYNISILDSSKTNHLLKCEYMSSATIAETPNKKNKDRYLLFFDNGSAAYVSKAHIYPIVDLLTLPIERLHFDYVYFVRNYFQSYPNRPLVRLEVNDVLNVFLSNNWFECKVLEVDNALVRFELDKKMFKNTRQNLKNNDIWFYRGSFRLFPIYEQLIKKLNNFKIDETVKLNQYENYAYEKLNKPLADDGFILTRFSSTFLPMFSHNQDSIEQGELIDLNLDCLMRNKLIDYISHECHYDCVTRWEVKLKKADNPLIVPLLNGWLRLISTKSSVSRCATQNKSIFYISPCGKRLRAIEDCDLYLSLTNSLLTSDMFSFDLNVKPNLEFRSHAKYFRLSDAAYGKERVPISCVNSVDNKKPPEFNYTSSLVSDDIDLNENTDNLECCDCTDNCNDKSKCSCWQKTFKYARLESDVIKNIGYKGKRLEQRVSTGIFECNSKCKCNYRCTNRVVQNGIQVRLELFKTYNKGWGVRCLDDLPRGTFISIYAGHLLTEEESNVKAAECGDEYFAELDYIGRLLKLKNENLSILTPSNSSENDSDNSNLKRKLSEINDDKDDDLVILSDSESNLSYEPVKLKREDVLKSIFSSKYFDDPKVYIIDAKKYGNISRFLNHSCSPNVFIQNVFIETNDLRYPQTAIFALSTIKAGTELTWDYNYQVGSIKGRLLYCYCKSSKCRGRLI